MPFSREHCTHAHCITQPPPPTTTTWPPNTHNQQTSIRDPLAIYHCCEDQALEKTNGEPQINAHTHSNANGQCKKTPTPYEYHKTYYKTWTISYTIISYSFSPNSYKPQSNKKIKTKLVRVQETLQSRDMRYVCMSLDISHLSLDTQECSPDNDIIAPPCPHYIYV